MQFFLIIELWLSIYYSIRILNGSKKILLIDFVKEMDHFVRLWICDSTMVFSLPHGPRQKKKNPLSLNPFNFKLENDLFDPFCARLIMQTNVVFKKIITIIIIKHGQKKGNLCDMRSKTICFDVDWKLENLDWPPSMFDQTTLIKRHHKVQKRFIKNKQKNSNHSSNIFL